MAENPSQGSGDSRHLTQQLARTRLPSGDAKGEQEGPNVQPRPTTEQQSGANSGKRKGKKKWIKLGEGGNEPTQDVLGCQRVRV